MAEIEYAGRKAKHIAIDVLFETLKEKVRQPIILKGTKTTRIKSYDLAIHLVVALDNAGLKVVRKPERSKP